MSKRQTSAKPLSRRELAQEISLIENRNPVALRRLKKNFSELSFSRSVCFTGPAGVGKSTLISHLVGYRAASRRLAWLACDPSSPTTGGSLLGDRIRLQGKGVSENLFVRSLSTRSAFSVSTAIRDIEVFLEAHFDEVWVETAGSGQTQREAAEVSAVTVLVLQPETGDEIQWMKSGMRELADIFVVHKADLPGAALMAQSLSEQGISPKRIVMISSAEPTSGHQELLDLLDQLKEKVVDKARLQKLHEDHARALFEEDQRRRIEKEFFRHRKAWAKNPYQVLG